MDSAFGWRSASALRFKHQSNPPALAAEVPRQEQAQAKPNCTDNPPLLVPAPASERSVECTFERRSILPRPALVNKRQWKEELFGLSIRAIERWSSTNEIDPNANLMNPNSFLARKEKPPLDGPFTDFHL